MKSMYIAVLTLLVGTVATPASWAEVDRVAQFEERIAETSERLNLSDEQIERLRPVLKSGFEAQMAVLADHGIDLENRNSGTQKKLGFREARKLRKDLDHVRKNTSEHVEGILSEKQFSEYKKIQDERKKKMREMIKERR